jgi:hypothetical protein
MQVIKMAVVAATFGLISTLGCGHSHGEGEGEAFDTFQECFDDHTGEEGFAPPEAVKICCIDHPIGTPPVDANVVCGETSQACQTYVTGNLADAASITAAELEMACDEYIIERAQ